MPLAKLFRSALHGDYLVVQPQETISNLSDPNTKAELEELLRQLKDPVVRGVVLDMHRLPYFGTYMLETMHRLWQPIRSKNGKMVLCNVSDVGREILRVAKFDKLWPIARNIQEALRILHSQLQSQAPTPRTSEGKS